MKLLQAFVIFHLLFIAAGIVDKAIAGDRLAHEADYQNAWCNQYAGKTEHLLRDKARVDCVVQFPEGWYAVEFDFADKWAEAIGQALYYGQMKNMAPGVVLIVEDINRDAKYIDRFSFATRGLDVRLWIMGPLQ